MATSILGIHHVALKAQGIEDCKNAIAFYHEVLELPIVRTWSDETSMGAMLATGGGVLEIMSTGTNRPGEGALRHLALATRDVDGCIEKVRSAGMKITLEPMNKTLPSNPPYPIRIAFFTGPLGEEVEFFCEC